MNNVGVDEEEEAVLMESGVKVEVTVDHMDEDEEELEVVRKPGPDCNSSTQGLGLLLGDDPALWPETLTEKCSIVQ